MLQWEEINIYGPLCARYALTPDIISHIFTVKQNSKRSKTSLSKLHQSDLLLVLTSSKLICFPTYHSP